MIKDTKIRYKEARTQGIKLNYRNDPYLKLTQINSAGEGWDKGIKRRDEGEKLKGVISLVRIPTKGPNLREWINLKRTDQQRECNPYKGQRV